MVAAKRTKASSGAHDGGASRNWADTPPLPIDSDNDSDSTSTADDVSRDLAMAAWLFWTRFLRSDKETSREKGTDRQSGDESSTSLCLFVGRNKKLVERKSRLLLAAIVAKWCT